MHLPLLDRFLARKDMPKEPSLLSLSTRTTHSDQGVPVESECFESQLALNLELQANFTRGRGPNAV